MNRTSRARLLLVSGTAASAVAVAVAGESTVATAAPTATQYRFVTNDLHAAATAVPSTSTGTPAAADRYTDGEGLTVLTGAHPLCVGINCNYGQYSTLPFSYTFSGIVLGLASRRFKTPTKEVCSNNAAHTDDGKNPPSAYYTVTVNDDHGSYGVQVGPTVSYRFGVGTQGYCWNTGLNTTDNYFLYFKQGNGTDSYSGSGNATR